MVLEKTLESPLDCKQIQEGDHFWVFIERTDAEAETPTLWPGRVWGLEEKGTTEDKMAGWHHQLDAHEFG